MTHLLPRLLFSICLVGAVAGWGSSAVRAAGAGQEAQTGAQAARPTFSAGDEFWFSDGRSIVVETFAGQHDGRLVFKIRSRQETYYYSADLALVEIRRPFGSDQVYKPDNAMLSFPLTVGKSWGRRFRVISFDGSPSVQRTRRCEVVGTGQTEVPAGTFATFRVKCTMRQLGARRLVHEELHYAPAVGRIILRRTSRPTTTIRLTEFTRAK